MHPPVRDWVELHAPDHPADVLEFGGADINGNIRDLFHPDGTFVSVDIVAGAGVDVVDDCRTYTHPNRVDVVVCCEVGEHCPRWQELVSNAAANLRPGGTLIFTAAGPGRRPHSAWGARDPMDGEWYRNISADELAACAEQSFDQVVVDELRDDVRLYAELDL